MREVREEKTQEKVTLMAKINYNLLRKRMLYPQDSPKAHLSLQDINKGKLFPQSWRIFAASRVKEGSPEGEGRQDWAPGLLLRLVL